VFNSIYRAAQTATQPVRFLAAAATLGSFATLARADEISSAPPAFESGAMAGTACPPAAPLPPSHRYFQPEECHNETFLERFKSIHRRISWKKSTSHCGLMHRDNPPYWLPNYGYYQTNWRSGAAVFPAEYCEPALVTVCGPAIAPVVEPIPPTPDESSSYSPPTGGPQLAPEPVPEATAPPASPPAPPVPELEKSTTKIKRDSRFPQVEAKAGRSVKPQRNEPARMALDDSSIFEDVTPKPAPIPDLKRKTFNQEGARDENQTSSGLPKIRPVAQVKTTTATAKIAHDFSDDPFLRESIGRSGAETAANRETPPFSPDQYTLPERVEPKSSDAEARPTSSTRVERAASRPLTRVSGGDSVPEIARTHQPATPPAVVRKEVEEFAPVRVADREVRNCRPLEATSGRRTVARVRSKEKLAGLLKPEIAQSPIVHTHARPQVKGLAAKTSHGTLPVKQREPITSPTISEPLLAAPIPSPLPDDTAALIAAALSDDAAEPKVKTAILRPAKERPGADVARKNAAKEASVPRPFPTAVAVAKDKTPAKTPSTNETRIAAAPKQAVVTSQHDTAGVILRLDDSDEEPSPRVTRASASSRTADHSQPARIRLEDDESVVPAVLKLDAN
jgi:hypothetical protein